MNIAEIFHCSLLKSAYINIKCLPFKQAMHFPILVSRTVKFVSLKGKIKLDGAIQFGLSGSGTSLYMPIAIENYGLLVFGDNVHIGGVLK